MKREDYRPLGEYILQTDIRNTELCDYPLLGVSVEKVLIPSVANTIGTDFSKYKILFPNEFVYIADTSRRGDKIAFALNDTGQPALVSSAYTTFKVNEQYLLSNYLMLWVSRPEFDRYARFMSHGSVRELFSWEEMCNVMLPVPSIEEQRRIVAEYQTVERRIKNNEALIQKLEETAQAIYHHTFVEGIDENNLPEGWRKGCLGEFCEYNTENIKSDKYETLLYLDTGSLINNHFYGYTLLNTSIDDIPSRAKRKVKEGDVLYSTVRPNLRHYGIIRNVTDNIVVSTGFIVLRSIIDYIPNEYLFMAITRKEVTESLHAVAEQAKATYPSIKDEDLMKLEIIIPDETCFKVGNGAKFTMIFSFMNNLHHENTHLRKLQSLLTSKLA